MAFTILENGMVSDAFEMGEAPMLYRDALVMRQSDYDALSPEEIQAMKQARYDNWIAIINAPPVEEPPVEDPVQE